MLADIDLPDDLSYATDGERKPLELYMSCLRNSKQLDLRLGYFSSSAIRVLSLGFAQFIYNGGRVRIITNHYLSEPDKSLIEGEVNEESETYNYIDSVVNKDVESLENILSNGDQHFFDCLKYLLHKGRLQLLPVKLKPGKLSHYKEGVFDDGVDQIYFNGSCNFTYSGLLENGESLEVKRSWGSKAEVLKVKKEKKRLDQIFSKTDPHHDYLDIDEIITVIKQKGQDKDLDELVEDELAIQESINLANTELGKIFEKEQSQFKEWIRTELKVPIFPYKKPHEYQSEAYDKWVANDYSGIFAMATGTGKTLTSLNCLLNEYKKTKVYRAVIAVPTIALVDQWKEECLKFNFQNIVTVSSKNQWKDNLAFFNTASKLIDTSYIVIVTYASLPRQKFQSYFTQLPNDTLFIADETHNLGSKSILKLLQDIHLKKRIGLSATPNRKFDEAGNEAIQDFFNDKPPYIVSFSMEKALKEEVLCKYKYHPHIVELTDEEMDKYKELSLQLLRMGLFDKETGNFRSTPDIERKLIERKRIIHKAKNKLYAYKSILRNEFEKKKNLKYTLIYVPEGSEISFENRDYSVQTEEEIRLINKYTKAVSKTDDSIMVKQFTASTNNRDEILKNFEDGRIHVLTSMKCLDEGVDVPRSELAIFCASTGNPRQFIQRRGRVLRLHDDKTYATIHDLVVVPKVADENTFEMEKGLVKKELERVVDFANLAMNKMHTYETFKSILDHYNLNLNDI